MKRFLAHVALALPALVAATACSQDPQEHLRRGNEYLSQKKYPEAIVELRTAVQADPRLAEARTKLADAYIATDDGANALAELVRAADLKPEDSKLQVRTGNLLLLARKFEDAKARADKALANDPNSLEAQLLRGNALAGLKQFDAAIKEYEDIAAMSPDQPDAYVGIGTISLRQGQQKDAEAAFLKAVQVDPKSVPARLGLAHFYLRTNRVADSERELKTALQMDPANVIINRALAIVYLNTGRAAEAEPYMAALAATSKTPQAKLTLAQYYLALKRNGDARRVYSELANVKEVRADALTRTAILDVLDGKTDAAKARLEEVLKDNPKNQGALLVKGELQASERKYAEALETVAVINQQAAQSANAYSLAGRVYEATNRTEDAIAAYEQAIKLNARAIPPILRLADISFRLGNLDKAATYADQVLNVQQGNAEAFALLARIDIRRGDLTAAGRRVAALEKGAPNAPGTYAVRAELQTASKQPAAAQASYAKALQLDPNNYSAIVGANSLDAAAGRHKDAIARVEGALSRTSRTSPLLVVAARAYGVSGDTAKAESLLKEAIDKDPTNSEAYGLLGQWYFSRRRTDDAIKQFEEIVKHNPKSVGAYTMLAILLEAQGKGGDAEKRYEQALAIDPKTPIAANNLAWIYAESGRNLDRALELAQYASQQRPQDPQIADTLGWVYVKKNMAPIGLPHLLRADAKSPAVQFHRGMAYIQTGDTDNARRSLKAALSSKTTFGWTDQAKATLAKLEVER